MDVRQNRPVDSGSSSSVASVAHSRVNDKAGITKLVWMLGAVVLVLLILGMLLKGLGVINASQAVNGKEYQALFLTNNQVYFGHLSTMASGDVKLTDIYYLQVQQASTDPKATTPQSISLAKLGSELHGPEDSMYVSKAQVLFWENLKNDGKVATAIANDKKK
jgi:hypothetical protein